MFGQQLLQATWASNFNEQLWQASSTESEPVSYYVGLLSTMKLKQQAKLEGIFYVRESDSRNFWLESLRQMVNASRWLCHMTNSISLIHYSDMVIKLTTSDISATYQHHLKAFPELMARKRTARTTRTRLGRLERRLIGQTRPTTFEANCYLGRVIWVRLLANMWRLGM